ARRLRTASGWLVSAALPDRSLSPIARAVAPLSRSDLRAGPHVDRFLVLGCPWQSLPNTSRVSRRTGRKPEAPARPQKRTCDSTRPRLSSQETRPRLRRSPAPTIDAAPQTSPGTSTSSSSVIGRTAETALVLRSYSARSRRVDRQTASAGYTAFSG